MTGAVPLDDALLAAVAAAIPEAARRVAVAVSGGSDSVALLHLLARIAPDRGLDLQAVTVDHRLRPEAAAEAALVGRICASLQVPHSVLTWEHGAVAGNLMQQARIARRSLISDWARAQGVDVVALGHTADDQAEGMLMALAREAGLDGLSGMAPLHQGGGGVSWLRPLLAQSRSALRDYLRRHGGTWIDDPTNADPRFLRTRARAALDALGKVGITPGKIAHSVALLGQSRAALASVLADFARDHVIEQAGALTLDRAALAALHPELRRLLIARAVIWISGADHPPRRLSQLSLLDHIRRGQSATLGGVRFRLAPRSIRIAREPRAVGPAVLAGQVWDGRWIVDATAGGEVRALGAAGLAQMQGWRATGLPRDALVVSPSVWDGARLIAAPVVADAGYGAARLAASFRSFLLSH